MKKFIKTISILLLFSCVISCGGGKDTSDPNLTPLQDQAVKIVKKNLNKGDKLLEYQVVEEIMPVSLLEQPFLQLRNTVFKAGLDYQSCKTRGLQAGMEMAENKLVSARQQILETDSLLQKNMGDNKSLIVLATVQARKSVSGEPQSLVVVFDPATLEVKEWLPVTTPVQNTVALVECARNNTLSEYEKEMNHDTKILAGNVGDPVLKFVLEAKAL